MFNKPWDHVQFVSVNAHTTFCLFCRYISKTFVYICIKGSGTYPCTPLSKRFLTVEKHQEKHKCIGRDGAFCCGYSGDRLGGFFRWASNLFLNIFTDEAVATSAGRSFHIFTTLWLKVNLRRSSLDRSFRSFDSVYLKLKFLLALTKVKY